MSELIVGLATLAIVLGVITLVGHGLWVLLARIFGGEKPQAEDFVLCGYCGRRTPSAGLRCGWCQRDLHNPAADELRDLAAVERQLQRWGRSGRLTPRTTDNLLVRLRGYREELLRPTSRPAERPAAPQPAAPPLAVSPAAAPMPSRRQEPAVAQVIPLAQMVQAPAAQPAATPQRPQSQAALVAAARPPAAPPPLPPPKPTPVHFEPEPLPRSWSEVLAAFMEERNIRWGELIGGLLIVGPAIALVISFWQQLAANPYLQLSTFVLTCSAVFGVGLYAHHRWKLRSTSLGLLIIATLLVPLLFLATAGVWKENWGPGTLAADVVTLGIFAWLTWLAGRVLVPIGPWLEAIAVVGSSAAILVAAHWVDPESANWWYIVVGCLPVACFGAAVGVYLARASRRRLDSADAGALLTLLGTAVFALLVALGMMVARSSGVTAAFSRLSLSIAVAGLPILACGLTLRRGVARDPDLAGWHVAGTTVALVGMTVMTTAVGLAWPHPLGMAAVAAIDAAALMLAAFRWRLPVLHAGAIACATLAYLTGFHMVRGGLPLFNCDAATMLDEIVSGSSGTALVGLFALYAIASEWLARRGRHGQAIAYAAGAGVMAVLGLMLSAACGLRGGGDATRAAVLSAIYGASGLAAAARWRRTELSYFGLGLLAAAPIWALWANPQMHAIRPIWGAVLAAEALAMAASGALARRLMGDRLSPLYRGPLLDTADAVVSLAVVIGGWAAWQCCQVIALEHSPALLAATACIAATYLVLAWQRRSPGRTWAGSLVVMAGLVHAAVWNYPGVAWRPWLTPLLTHATLAAGAAMLLGQWSKRGAAEDVAMDIRRVLGAPLGDSAVLSSLLTLPVLPLVSWPSTASLAACLYWLAAIWLAIAWRRRSTALFAAHQLMLVVATIVATAAWLKNQSWLVEMPRDLLHPYSLQAFGVALGVLSLLWIAVRIALRRDATARQLLDPARPTVDWMVRHALVIAQLAVAVFYLLPSVVEELGGYGVGDSFRRMQPLACGAGAWLFLGVCAAMQITALWHRWSKAELLSALLLAAIAPCLVAGRFAGDLAVAPALAWGLAGCFLASSAAIWGREPLLRLCQQLRMNVDLDRNGTSLAHGVSLAVAALPALVLSVASAFAVFAGVAPGGPAAGSVFHRLGPGISHVVPLALVMLGMVGHALRESSAGYAFSAGLVAQLVVAVGYALGVVPTPSQFAVPESVTLLQLATITAAAWAMAWLAVRQRVNVWREVPGALWQDTPSDAALMSWQLGMGVAGNVLLIGVALFALALQPPSEQSWTIAAGSPLGWIALCGSVAAGAYRRTLQGRRISANAIGLIGMTVVGLAACTVRWGLPAWGPVAWASAAWAYRTLMLGWAIYAALMASAMWWVASLPTHRHVETSERPKLPVGLKSISVSLLVQAASTWVRAAGLLAVLLGLKAVVVGAVFAYDDHEHLWAAAAIAIASSACATMAVWRRQEGWAFSAALGTNLAASLVVWFFYRDAAFGQWWLPLVEANVIASSTVAIVWLAARRRLYQSRQLTLDDSPLLGTQIALPVAGMVALLALPVAWLVRWPAYLPESLARMADWPGWLALVLVAAAAAWYLGQVSPAKLLHGLGALVAGVGVLAACYVGRNHASAEDRLAYHALTIAWAAGAMAILVIAWLGRHFAARLIGRTLIEPLAETGAAGAITEGWMTAIGAAAFMLTVMHAASDVAGAWWSIGAILSLSVTSALLALWRRLPAYVFLSGLLLNAAGVVGWLAWGPATLTALVEINVLCLAAGSVAWSLLEGVHREGVPHWHSDSRPLSFAHGAAVAAVGLLAAHVVAAVAADLFPHLYPRVGIDRTDWMALGAAAVAVTVCLWDRKARFVPAAQYTLGLLSVAMALCQPGVEPRPWCWRAASSLPAFALAAAMLGWLFPRMRPAWRLLRIPTPPEGWPVAWFPQAQAALIAASAAFGTWVSLDAGFDAAGGHGSLLGLAGRLAGNLGATCVLAAAIVMAAQVVARWRTAWQYATFAAGVLLLGSLGWARLDLAAGTPTGDAPWLHYGVILMIAAVLTLLTSGLGLGRILPGTSDWIAAGRRAAPVLGALSLATLAAVLVEERTLFDPADKAMLAAWAAPWAIAAVAGAMVGLVVGCLACALAPAWDPLRLGDRRRTAYVYAAEALLALAGLHLRVALPGLFALGIVKQYWMLIVMAIAFAGAGLSVLFQRRRMPILSEPLERTALLLPIFPPMGSLFIKNYANAGTWFLGSSGPAFWLLMGIFYCVMAVRKRSLWLAALGILTGNMGLWVLWRHCGWGFIDHPQLWLIPLALSALVAEHLDRRRLSEAQRSAIRYLALAVIYVSSTTEFWRAIGQSAVLPLVTILLAVFGVLAGILLRVRSFLYLGVTFLVVVIGRMIVYAAFERNQMWVFWACCILLGMAIIALFAVFEKRRNDVLMAVERFKQWKP